VEQINAVSTVVGTAVTNEYLGGSAIGTAQKNWAVSNLPLYTAKVKMATAGTNNIRYFVGLSDMQATALGAPTNGVYFTNCSVAAGTTCDTTLRAVVQTNTTTQYSSAVCGTIDTTKFMYLRIEVRAANDVHFFADMDVSNGINEVECGTGFSNATNIPAAALTYMTKVDNNTGGAATATLQIDFVRIWQDDAADPGLTVDASSTSSGNTDSAATDATQAPVIAGDDPNASPDVSQAASSGALDAPETTSSSDPAAPTASDPATSDVITSGSFISNGGGFQLLDAAGHKLITFDQSGSASFSGNLDLASANVTGGLSVGGDLSVGGLSSFQKLATFFAKVIFRQDVEFDGHITVAKDTAGYATLRSGESKVHITFANEYDVTPIITATITNGQFGQYSVDNVDTKGFDIALKDPATADTTFSWAAVGAITPQTATNPATTPSNP
jgi:hypothetical protein